MAHFTVALCAQPNHPDGATDSAAHALLHARREMVPEKRRRFGDLRVGRPRERLAHGRRRRAAGVAGVEVPRPRRRERAVDQIDEFDVGEVRHRSSFFRLASA